MSFEVLLTEGAARDLEDIFDGIARRDDSGNATYVLDRIEAAFTGLSEFPERGVSPGELLELARRHDLFVAGFEQGDTGAPARVQRLCASRDALGTGQQL